MKLILLIGAGSFIGGVSRYLLSQFIQTKTLNAFPYGTLTVNLIGCLLIGIVYGICDRGNLSQEVRLFLATGMLGGFTTFSAFSNDTIKLMNEGHMNYAIIYVLSSVLIGVTATFLGLGLTRLF